MPRWLDGGLRQAGALDRRWALGLHRSTTRPALLRLLVCTSRLGDAPAWLLLAALLPLLDTTHGAGLALQLVVLGSVNLALYLALKLGTRRMRPCQQCAGIRARMRPADRFSFPSGHTLHAVAFAALLAARYPLLALPLALFAVLVALSRVVLGLHYPSDVLAGALIGLGTASTMLLLSPPPG